MRNIAKYMMGVVFIMGLVQSSSYAKPAGILIVGTQAEVQKILSKTKLVAHFSEENPTAMVAVKLHKHKMTVYEHHAVDAILDFLGDLVHGAVVITLHVGTDLWNLLNDLVGVVVDLGHNVAHAILTILSDAANVIVDGLHWVVMAADAVLNAIASFLGCLFP